MNVDRKEKGQGKSRSIPLAVVVAAWIFSVVMTVAILMVSGARPRRQLRIARKGPRHEGNRGGILWQCAAGPIRPYQRLLRDARQARAREDFKAERLYYRQVLDLLRTEPGYPHSGLGTASSHGLEQGITGSREHDRDLEKLIITVLGD